MAQDETFNICGLANRKDKHLTKANITNGTISIGDAAYSYCVSLQRVIIPKSVCFIGVAAFCCSGLEEVIFEGVPEIIEPAVFVGCNNLRGVFVPKGQKQHFCEVLGIDKNLVYERTDNSTYNYPVKKKESVQMDKQAGCVSITYNNHIFNWNVGDIVSLDELFSGPTIIKGDPSYQFRKKALFIFLHSKTAKQIQKSSSNEYALSANTFIFKQKYQDKYTNRNPRIFVLIWDYGKIAQFYDEVKLQRISEFNITVKSII